jgi:hypothetical protein
MKAEVRVLKTEIIEAMKRRLEEDDRDPTLVFGIASTAVGEVLADLIFAAAQDEEHGEQLLGLVNSVVRSRWNFLASREKAA